MITTFRKHCEDTPNDYQFALVYFPNASQSCHKIAVRYYRKKIEGYAYGWYPGGSSPIGTLWAPLDEVVNELDKALG